MLSFSCLFSLLSHRLQDLTVRDLEKQEREKAANSLEAFIFETQVGRLGGTLVLGSMSVEALSLQALSSGAHCMPALMCTSLGQAVPA